MKNGYQLKNLKKGFAVVLYKHYARYAGNTYAIRMMADKDDAYCNARALSLVDGVNYAVYDCVKGKLVY